ncbi:MAG: hypothetical protein ABIJ03_02660 [Patescibacteria group bacterium]|nr:hypothetical protein [Patescibacteria group bacterium]
MRRREKFVITALLLSGLFLGIQYTNLNLRGIGVGLFGLIVYLVATWALSDDLDPHERLTIVPFPALFAVGLAWFYFLLPTTILSRLLVAGLFSVGIYAILLSANIFSVAKGRTIQLLYAAHAVWLFFTLLTSLLFANTIFTLRLPVYLIATLIFISHAPLVFMSLYAVKLQESINSEMIWTSLLVSLIVTELAVCLAFFPFSVWFSALFIMSLVYISLGVVQSLLKERLFTRTWREYSLVAGFVILLFILAFPGK